MGDVLLKALSFVAIIAVGYVLKRIGFFKAEDAKLLSKIVIYLTLPAALIGGFETFSFSLSLLVSIVVGFVASVILLAVGFLLSRGREGTVRALYGLNLPGYNIGTFVMPFVQRFLEPAGIVVISMFDMGQALWSLGGSYAVVFGSIAGERRVRLRDIVSKLFHSAPFLTYFVMFVLSLCRVRLPAQVFSVAKIFGSGNAFLAMLMIGVMFDLRLERSEIRDVVRILGARYLLNAVFAAAVWALLPVPALVKQVLTVGLFASIPTVTTAYCEKCGCKSSVSGVLGSLSILISLALVLALLLSWS